MPQFNFASELDGHVYDLHGGDPCAPGRRRHRIHGSESDTPSAQLSRRLHRVRGGLAHPKRKHIHQRQAVHNCRGGVPVITILVGKTMSADGATAELHFNNAPMQPAFPSNSP